MTKMERWHALLLMSLAAAAPRSAEALLITLPDGSFASGCGTAATAPRRPARAESRLASERNYVTPGGSFRVHFNTSENRTGPVAPTDADGNGVPDWVDLVATVADSLEAMFRGLGYTNPLGDGGAGSGPEYDLYVTELSGQQAYGFTWPGSDGYMQIDNDYSEALYGTHGEAGLRVTLAHELYHAVQFTYVGGFDIAWWQETTATFMEEIAYPDIDDYLQYLNPELFSGRHTFFEDPSWSLNYKPSNSDAHMYGAAVFCHFLDQSAPEVGQEAIKYTFQHMEIVGSSTAAVVAALEEKMGRRSDDLLADFWVWCYFSGDRTIPGRFFRDAAGYAYPPPNDVPDGDWIVSDLSSRRSVGRRAEVSPLGGWIVRFAPDGSEGGFRLRLQGIGSSPWAWRVVVVGPDSVAVFVPEDGRMDVGGWDRMADVVLVAANGSVSGDRYAFTYTAEYDPALERPTAEALVVELEQNRPNPFNVSTEIPFSLSAAAPVRLSVFDVTGRKVRTLLDGVWLSADTHGTKWDGLTTNGRAAAAGAYTFRLDADGVVRVRRMTLLR